MFFWKFIANFDVLLYHRACAAIAEVKRGVEVKCKHQSFKIIL